MNSVTELTGALRMQATLRLVHGAVIRLCKALAALQPACIAFHANVNAYVANEAMDGHMHVTDAKEHAACICQ